MRTKLTAVLSLVATVIAMLVAASPASATTNQASDSYPYCVVQAQNTTDQNSQPNTFTCYANYTNYSNDIDSYANFVATMYTGTNYTGWRLAIVSQHGCLDGGVNYDKYVSDLAGSGFRDRISSSKVYGSNCTGGFAFDNAYYGCLLNIDYGYDTSNGGYVPNWGAESDKADSLYIAHLSAGTGGCN